MADLNPLGLLLIYITLAISPPDAAQVELQFSDRNRMTFTRTLDGWWSRQDELGKLSYWKREAEKLQIRDSEKTSDTIDLSDSFQITGKENWQKPVVIKGKSSQRIEISPDKKKSTASILIKTRDGERTGTITWRRKP